MDNWLASHLVSMTEIMGSNSLSMDEMDIQRCGKWCGTDIGQWFTDYLVNAIAKHLVRQVVSEWHKSLIYWKVDLTKFNYHTCVEYDFSGIFCTKLSSSPLFLMMQVHDSTDNSFFVIQRYHCRYKLKKNALQMKDLGESLRLSRNNCVPLQKKRRGLW